MNNAARKLITVCVASGMTEATARRLIKEAQFAPPEQGALFTALPVQIEGFADCWSVYPQRSGTNNSKEAEREYLGCIKRGAKPEEIKQGTLLYARRMERTGKAGSQYVLQGKNFFKNEQWRDELRMAGHGQEQQTNHHVDERTAEANRRAAHGAAVMAGAFLRNSAQRR